MMTDDQTAELLALAAAFDSRTIGDADVDAWHAIAVSQSWTWPLARRALIAHYGESRQRIMPADITQRITAARHQLHEVFEIPWHPPELADDGNAFVTWAQRQEAAHMAAGLTEWAETGRLPALLEIEA